MDNHTYKPSSLKDTEKITSTKTPGTVSVEPSSTSSTESTGLLMTSEALSSNPSLDSSTHSGGLNKSANIGSNATLLPTNDTTITTSLPITPRLSTSSENSNGTHTTSSMNLFTSSVVGLKTTNYEVTSLKFHSTDRTSGSHASTFSTKMMTSSINTISAYKTSTDMIVPFISNPAKFSQESTSPHTTKQQIVDVSFVSSVTDEIISSVTDDIRDTSSISSSLKTNFDKTTPVNLDTEKSPLFSSLVTASSTMMHTDITVQPKQNNTKHTYYPVTPRKTSLFTQTSKSYESTQPTILLPSPVNPSLSSSLLPDMTRPAKPNTTIASHKPATEQHNDIPNGTKESIKTTTTFKPTLLLDKTTPTVDSTTITVPNWNVTTRVNMSLTVTESSESATSSTLRQPVTSIRSGSNEISSSQTSGTLPNGVTSSLNVSAALSTLRQPVTSISSGSNESLSSQTSGTLPDGFTSSLNFTSSSAYTSPLTGTTEQSTTTLNVTTIRRKEQQKGVDEDILSTSAIFGIAVGSLCVLALLGSVVYCSCQTRRSLHYSNPYSPSSNNGVNHMKNSSLANGNMKNGNVHIEYENPGTSNGVLKTDNALINKMTTETMVHNENMSNGLDKSSSFNTRLWFRLVTSLQTWHLLYVFYGNEMLIQCNIYSLFCYI